jgi:hypothetical protein
MTTSKTAEKTIRVAEGGWWWEEEEKKTTANKQKN